MSQKNMPIGKDDFSKIREGNYYYVDKTMLIKQIVDAGAEVTLITRPRRFGKSLNMSMLDCFFDVTRKNSKELFDGLKITEETELCRDWMNQYPTIYITLKSVSRMTFEDSYGKLVLIIAQLFSKHSFLFESDNLSETDRIAIDHIVKKQPTDDELTNSLYLLSKLMYQHYGKKAIILIDEYDVPMSKGNTYGYYPKITDIIRSMLDDALKTNEYLQMGVVTGCLRIAKESIFTGLNNPAIDSISKGRIDEFFGFTESEVDQILSDYGFEDKKPIIKEWYDGYQFGRFDVYCPWDVINYISDLRTFDDAEPQCYWANTSGVDVIRPFLKKFRAKLSDYFTVLFNGGTVNAVINEKLTYLDINSSDLDNFWSLLYLCGYLTTTRVNGKANATALKIPNEEIKIILQQSITQWFKNDVVPNNLEEILRQMWACDDIGLQNSIGDLLFKAISFYDYSEEFYHAFLAGILVTSPYDVKSNRENGEGRTDVTLEDLENRRAAIFEFKVAKNPEDLEERACAAIKQIDDRGYAKQLLYEGYKEIIKIGIGYFKKRCVVKIEKITN